MDESVLRQVQDLGARAAAIVGQPPVEGNEQEKADEGFGLGSLFLFWKILLALQGLGATGQDCSQNAAMWKAGSLVDHILVSRF